MYFLLQIKIEKDGTITKGTSDFPTMKEAMIAFHVALSSAMQKEEVQKFTALIVNENGLQQKLEVYEAPTEAEELITE